MAFGGFQQQGDDRPIADINTTPLVDVMLVLLVIFMITAPLLTSAIRVNLPTVSAPSIATPPETIAIGIDAENRYVWNKEPVGPDELRRRLRERASADPQPEIHLYADKLARYEALALVLGHAQQAGLSKIGFVTQPTTP